MASVVFPSMGLGPDTYAYPDGFLKQIMVVWLQDLAKLWE
jgi:hypothetical protein